jgi:hypothetical protein
MMMTTIDLSTLERATERIIMNTTRKCTLCNKEDCLIRLDDELQHYSKKKGFESYFCTTTLQVVNFVKK